MLEPSILFESIALLAPMANVYLNKMEVTSKYSTFPATSLELNLTSLNIVVPEFEKLAIRTVSSVVILHPEPHQSSHDAVGYSGASAKVEVGAVDSPEQTLVGRSRDGVRVIGSHVEGR